MKRPQEETDRKGNKKQKQSDNQRKQDQKSNPNTLQLGSVTSHSRDYALPPADTQKASVPGYLPFTVAAELPPLPPLPDVGSLAVAPFRHKSTISYDRTSGHQDLTYVRLEFLGDAYLEVIASRLIFHHFPSLPAGAQSQVRELLVKNETLAEYAKAYGFEQKLVVADMERMLQDAKHRGNKGLNKILGDVFEAYLAAIILADADEGFAIAEKWLTALWAPKLLQAAQSHMYKSASLALHADSTEDALTAYDPTAKSTLQRRITGPMDVKLKYEPYKASVELKGNQLGQNRHYEAVFLTGWGHEKTLLGQGEGKNKVEAGNWAAIQAMHGENKALVDDCEKQLQAWRAKKALEKEAREKTT